MGIEEKQGMIRAPHSLILESRKRLTATGVSNVDSFDEDTIVADTSLGELVIKGKGLHISKLNLETGELELDGEVDAVHYTDNKPANRGFFAKLFQ